MNWLILANRLARQEYNRLEHVSRRATERRKKHMAREITLPDPQPFTEHKSLPQTILAWIRRYLG